MKMHPRPIKNHGDAVSAEETPPPLWRGNSDGKPHAEEEDASELIGLNPQDLELVYSSHALIHVEMRCESAVVLLHADPQLVISCTAQLCEVTSELLQDPGCCLNKTLTTASTSLALLSIACLCQF